MPVAFPLFALQVRLREIEYQVKQGSNVQTACPWAIYLPNLLCLERRSLDGAAVEPSICEAQAGCDDSPHSSEECQHTSDSSMPLGTSVEGRVWRLSTHRRGCREVQAALEAPVGEQARAAIASELRSHVVEAYRCPHANHVLQKCIVMMRPQSVQFIIDEIMMGKVFAAVRHKYGCRVVVKLLEHGLPGQLRGLVQALLTDVASLARHTYANYVVQKILEGGTDDQRRRIAEALKEDISGLCREKYGCAVVRAALLHLDAKDQAAIANAILEAPGLIAVMAKSRQGRLCVTSVLEVIESSHARRVRSS